MAVGGDVTIRDYYGSGSRKNKTQETIRQLQEQVGSFGQQFQQMEANIASQVAAMRAEFSQQSQQPQHPPQFTEDHSSCAVCIYMFEVLHIFRLYFPPFLNIFNICVA